MTEKEVFKNFITSANYTESRIEQLKLKLSVSDRTLITKTFKLLNEEIGYLNRTTDFIHIITNCVEFLNVLCNEKEFTEKEVLVNRKRIKKARESLLAYSNKYKNEELLQAANKLDEIILDKGIELDDLITLIKNLIDIKEEFNIIKKLLNTNKGVLITDNNELFDFTFNKAIDSIKNNTPDIYYYIALLKIFYSSKVDKLKYLKELDANCDDDNEFANEIYYIIHGHKRILAPDKVFEKYGVITNMQTVNVITKNLYNNADYVITIDTEGAQVRDDAISIKKDDKNYIIGIHIVDPASTIIPDGIIDYQAKNNYSCTYLPEKTIKIFPDNIEKAFSMDKSEYRQVLSMYIVIDNTGEVLDYSIKPDVVKINENLNFTESDLLLDKYNNENGIKIKQFYEVSCLLEQKNKEKYLYWDKKENDSIDKRVKTHKSDKIISELMVLYNHLISKIAYESNIPYVYRTNSGSYLNDLVKQLDIQIDIETQKIIDNIYLHSKYSDVPGYHNGLNLDVYSHSTSPLRRYPDLYNLLLMHGLYFKDMNYEYDEEYHKALINYFNQRSIELSLMASEYSRALKLKKD